MAKAHNPYRGGSIKVLTNIHCQYCNKLFSPRNSTRRYCSKKCRALGCAPRVAEAIRKIPRKCAVCENPTKRQDKKFCSPECSYRASKGRKMSEEFCNKMKKIQFDRWKDKKNPTKRAERKRIRMSPEWRNWREKVFKRDNYACVLCGTKGHLHPDHIKKFADYPELAFDVSNGRTLCIPCHRKTPTYGNRKSTSSFF